MFFVVAPVVVFIFINIFAIFYGVKPPSIGFLVDWVKLTVITYWWVIRCAFHDETVLKLTSSIVMQSLLYFGLSYHWW